MITCAKFCPSVHHIQTVADLRLEWFTNAKTVGLTAGTSTPDEIIECVEARLMEFAACRLDGVCWTGGVTPHSEAAAVGAN
jgi:4-hydroxy-3-methylbut-2-enyl diphosphate reductase IspH